MSRQGTPPSPRAHARRLRNALLGVVRGLALSLMGLSGSVALLAAAALSLCLVPLGVGLLTTPAVLRLVRAHAGLRRRLARRWSGVEIPAGYRPLPAPRRPGLAGRVETTVHLLKDPATWRDLAWLPLDASAGAVLALIAPGLLAQGLFGLLLPLGLWQPIVAASGTYWYTFVPVDSGPTAQLAGLTGAVFVILGLGSADLLTGWHFRIACAPLGGTARQRLSRRVERLTETRHDAVDASAAELRRIERDLHDGAQARLVAMGMNLGTVEALLDTDPEQARTLLAQARRSSVETLAELRDLVRGIHPPVLAERGLVDAVRALALRLAPPVEVSATGLAGRLAEPVESAAYFATSEVLANAVKHSGAERVHVDLHYRAESATLCIRVTDDGRGGASADAGTGLRGIRRRLGAFDGALTVNSPAGGPTVVTMEIPCAPPRG